MSKEVVLRGALIPADKVNQYLTAARRGEAVNLIPTGSMYEHSSRTDLNEVNRETPSGDVTWAYLGKVPEGKAYVRVLSSNPEAYFRRAGRRGLLGVIGRIIGI